jgi:hypothetical protein
MRRTSLLSVAFLGVAALIAACGESNPAGTHALAESPIGQRRGAPVVTAGECTTLSNLLALADSAFGAGSPDANSAKGKINNLQHQLDIGDSAGLISQAYNIVSFTLKKNSQSPLPGGSAVIVRFLNAVFCYAGLSMSITDPANSFLIYPSDLPQTLIGGDSLAGIKLDSFPVSEPTLITVAPIPFTQTGPGSGPLDTKLDQYPGFYYFQKFSATGAPLTRPAVVAVCPATSVSAAVRSRLRLGHGASFGFELTPSADGGFLTCPPPAITTVSAVVQQARSTLNLSRVKSLDTFGSGGVGGTVTELSPFGTVDATLSFSSGGVGGTVTELIRTKLRSAVESAVAATPCSAMEAPVGTPLAANCRPNVLVKTHLGTRMVNVPVQWSVESGGGVASAQDAAQNCLAGQTTSYTSLTGRAAACWTLGVVPGPNTVRATPGVGGDIPSGAGFDTTSILFTATANAPTSFTFLAQPSGTITAGSAFSVTAAAVDHNGVIAQGWNGAVTLTLNHGTFAGGVTSLTATAVNGVASFTGVSITAAGTDYRVQASADFYGIAVTTIGDSFNVGPAAAYGLSIVSGNGQTALAGTTLPANPTVGVNDVYGNVVPGAAIGWTAGGSSTGSVSPTASMTGANGQAATSWTIGAGANELRATLSRGVAGDTAVLFTATGTTPTLVSLNACAPGGSGDPFTDAASPYAFFIPDPGAGKTIQQVQLYVSSAGKANAPSPYQLRLSIQRATFDPALSVPVYATANVFLRGSNSEQKMVTFTLPTPLVGANGSSAKAVMMRLDAVTNPDGAKLSFNTGACSPGKNCNPPPGCKATEVSSPLPYPSGTFYRKSVGINVLGN